MTCGTSSVDLAIILPTTRGRDGRFRLTSNPGVPEYVGQSAISVIAMLGVEMQNFDRHGAALAQTLA